MSKQAVSFRFSDKTLERLDSLSRRFRQSRSRVVSDLVEEGLRMDQHPGIAFRTGPSGRRPGLVGGPDIWEVIAVFHQFTGKIDDSISKTAKISGLNESQVRTAVRYYSEYKQEIDAWIDDNEAQAAEAERIWQNQQTAIPN